MFGGITSRHYLNFATKIPPIILFKNLFHFLCFPRRRMVEVRFDMGIPTGLEELET